MGWFTFESMEMISWIGIFDALKLMETLRAKEKIQHQYMTVIHLEYREDRFWSCLWWKGAWLIDLGEEKDIPGAETRLKKDVE